MIVRNVRTGAVTVDGVAVANTPAAILAATRAQMVVTPRQARLAMIQTSYAEYPSLLTAVEGAIYASGDAALIVSWEYATEWQRNDPSITTISAALGLTDTDVDALFARAMAL